MPLLFANQWISGAVIKALCWTFIHSLWQGMVAAIVAGVIIYCTRKAKPQLRYTLLVLLFALFILVTGASFLYQLSYVHAANGPSDPLPLAPGNVLLVPYVETTVSGSSQGLLNRFTDYFNEHAALVVLMWAVVFMAKCAQVFSGLQYIQRIRKQNVYPALHEWAEKTKQLAKRMGIIRPVVLLQSAKLDAPVTVGYLKATILVPLGLLANLPPDQVEAVLLHELAHIRRKDYLVNLLQSFAETIFFFNPAILWISSLIRQEREAACDDLVLAHLPHKKAYFEALVSFQEYSLARSGHAMALLPQKHHLLHRIKRMLTHENQKLNTMEKTMLLFGIVAISAFGFISKQEPISANPPIAVAPVADHPAIQPRKLEPAIAPKKAKQNAVKPLAVARAKKDTVPQKEKNLTSPVKSFSSISTRSNDDGKVKTYEVEATDTEGKKYHIKKQNDVVTEFTVDGKEVPKEEYTLVLEQIERLQKEGSEKRKQEFQQRKIEMEGRKKEYMEKRKALMKENEEKRAQKGAEKKQLRAKYDQNKKLFTQKKQEMRDSLRLKEVLLRKYALSEGRAGAGGNNEVRSIISDLMAKGVITGTETLSFDLDDQELKVNGVKQPSSLHQSLKEKYLNKPGDHYNYSKNGGTTSITISKE
jgi:bla regulator protein blaR1